MTLKLITTTGLQVEVVIGLAPKGWTSKMVIEALRRDPHQTRVSIAPIMLTHPRTGKTRVLSEFVEDLVGEQRFGIETEDAVLLISRITNSALGAIFLPMGAIHIKREIAPVVVRD